MSRCTAVVEPGRSLVGPYGVLIASVMAQKSAGERRLLVIDAGMTDLLRPALYGSRHRIERLDRPPRAGDAVWRVVGPVCESTDEFGDYPLGDPPPDQVVIRDAGAYGFVMASHYNGRALPAEIFVHADGRIHGSGAGSAAQWIEERMGA